MLAEAIGHPRLVTADGVRLAATFELPPATPKAVAVVVHGFTGTSRHPDVVGVVRALIAAGYAVLSYDGRGHGDSDGMCTLGDAEAADVAAAVATARDHGDRIVTVGASMGAIAVLRHAVHDAALAGVVIVSCPAQWRLHSPQSALGALLTRTWPGRQVLLRTAKVRVAPRWTNPTPPEMLIGRVASPVAIVHGAADRFIPANQARRLAAHAPGVCRLDIVAGMGHAFDPCARDVVVAAADWALAQS
ncbi:MAG: alpha/beta hydrolase [Acidimicrobiales bacterium]